MNRAQQARQDEILRQLDRASEESNLLTPWNVNYPSAALRLEAFASKSEWALVFQMPSWARHDGIFVNTIQVFGDNTEPGPVTKQEIVLHPVEGDDFWTYGGNFLVDLHDFSVLVNGELVRVTATAADYERAGISLSDMPAELAYLRMLAGSADLCFSHEELCSRFGRSLDSHLFTLNEWELPDPADDERPSDLACFQEIAAAIAEKRVPDDEICTKDANTDWRMWTWISD